MQQKLDERPLIVPPDWTGKAPVLDPVAIEPIDGDRGDDDKCHTSCYEHEFTFCGAPFEYNEEDDDHPEEHDEDCDPCTICDKLDEQGMECPRCRREWLDYVAGELASLGRRVSELEAQAKPERGDGFWPALAGFIIAVAIGIAISFLAWWLTR